MSELNQTIKELYKDTLSDGEVELAKDNLLGFFKLLQEIDTRLQREAQTPQNASQNAIQRTFQGKSPRTKSNTLKSTSNKSQNANIGSSN